MPSERQPGQRVQRFCGHHSGAVRRVALLQQEVGAKHDEREEDKELGDDEEFPPSEFIHHQDRDRGAGHLDHPYHDRADVRVKMSSSVLEDLNYIGTDHLLNIQP